MTILKYTNKKKETIPVHLKGIRVYLTLIYVEIFYEHKK